MEPSAEGVCVCVSVSVARSSLPPSTFAAPVGWCWSCHPVTCVCCPQGDVPWDEKDFRYLLVGVMGVASVLLYVYLRDEGREISWKDFVRSYVSRGVVSSAALLEEPLCHTESPASVCVSRWNAWK